MPDVSPKIITLDLAHPSIRVAAARAVSRSLSAHCSSIIGSTLATGIGFVLVLIGGCASPSITVDAVYFPSPPTVARVVHLKSFNRLGDLIPLRYSFVQQVRGNDVSPSVGRPAGLDYRNGHLYICDADRNVVHDWNLVDATSRWLDGRDEAPLIEPVDVDVGDDGTIYVADTGRGEVVVFSPNGDVFTKNRHTANPSTERYRPVAVHVSGDHVFVADIAGHRIDVYAAAGGTMGTNEAHTLEPLRSIGQAGTASGFFYYPMGVCVDDRGNLFVSDMMNGRIEVFDQDFSFVRSFGQPGNRYGDLGKPRHIDIGPDGTLFIADTEFSHVHLFNQAGQLLMLLGGPEDRAGGTPMPVGVAVAHTLPQTLTDLVPHDFDASYYLFVSNSIGTHRISLFAIGVGR